jgi:hypothetical protein
MAMVTGQAGMEVCFRTKKFNILDIDHFSEIYAIIGTEDGYTDVDALYVVGVHQERAFGRFLAKLILFPAHIDPRYSPHISRRRKPPM